MDFEGADPSSLTAEGPLTAEGGQCNQVPHRVPPSSDRVRCYCCAWQCAGCWAPHGTWRALLKWEKNTGRVYSGSTFMTLLMRRFWCFPCPAPLGSKWALWIIKELMELKLLIWDALLTSRQNVYSRTTVISLLGGISYFQKWEWIWL